MELVWYDINLKQPTKKISGIEYIVTVYSPYWQNHVQSKVMKYEKEDRKGVESWIWKLDGNKIPSTWKITHWTHIPDPAWKE